ncbi:Methyltransferase domain-containing protein [Blastococcus aurantiacus]|uniref:Methyltransferase domain-containing protein n=1 Tax=Blastococcus aurantiacus TaxID=1550231 RepID=A0A1G7MUI1_9ACTN|nr:methyltransferase domain-containing protein [Blastococcus aurantiacus]SDF65423.1 Methyltransferase domain-containing protein [Blastococcus aurantiacus]
MKPHRLLARNLSARSRAQKVEWLRARIEPGASVLLVGASGYEAGGVDTNNAVERGVAAFTKAHALVYQGVDPRIGCPWSAGDGCALPFADASFDYVVSNAVIEHVGGPGRAELMLAESRRVARLGAFHTTPDRWFPIEVHTQVPLLHWLPRSRQAAAFAQAGKSFWNTEHYWLFGRRDFSALDPNFSVRRINPMTLIAEWSPVTALQGPAS